MTQPILCQIDDESAVKMAAVILAVTMAPQETQARAKRILHVVDSFLPEAGGTTEGIRKLAESCGSACSVEIACLDEASQLKDDGFIVHALGPARGAYRYSPRWKEWLDANVDRFDGVVIHGLWQHHSYGTYRVIHKRRPYVVFPHGMLDPYFRRAFPFKHLKKQAYWLARERRVLRDARAVCFTTPIERDLGAHTFWPCGWTSVVVSFGTTTPKGDAVMQREIFRAHYPQLRGRRFFLFLSRIHRKKGCDLLIEAFARLAPAYPDVDLVIAGPDEGGLRPQLEAQAKRFGLDARVHWTGMLEGGLKWGAFHAAEAFVLPSHQENFGIAVVEALACGVPVVISNKVNIWPDIAADGAGIVRADTVAGTYDGMVALLTLPIEERQRMIHNGLNSFASRYEMRRTAEALLGLF